MSFGFAYSKFAIESLTAAFANQYEAKKLRFNVLVPGRTLTTGFPLLDGEIGEQFSPDHVAAGLLCMLDIDMTGEVIDAVQEMKR